jgi:glucan endo-1,3-beta-D-glucosidase
MTDGASPPSLQIGMDAYPFYETENDNTIDNAADLFFKGYNATVAVAKGKPVKVTETGWASQGPSFGKAIADVPSAAQYWHTVGCRLFGNIDTWWFTLDDTKADPNTLAFSILKPYFGDPLWDLTCPAS